jgi:murein L,D-transpeptidase YafK
MNEVKLSCLTGKALRAAGLVLVALILSSCSWFGSSNPIVLPPKNLEMATQKDCGLPFCEVNLNSSLWLLSNPTIYVYKTERRLQVVDNKILVRDYHIALGPQPKGDKYLRGDGRTPEGEFFVCVKNPSSKYHKGLGLNYPSTRHAEDAYVSGMISREEYDRIVRANEKKTLPPHNTRLGGDIFIHGGGSVGDWTLGCVALRNSDIDELFDTIPIGTPVKIMP